MFLCPDCKRYGITMTVNSDPPTYTCKYCSFTADLSNPSAMRRLTAYRNIMPEVMTRTLSISQPAWDTLVVLGRQYGYVRAEGNANNIYKFIAALTQCEFIDQRPSYISGTDQWCLGVDVLFHRRVKLSDDTIKSYGDVARRWHIWPYRYQSRVLDGYVTHISPGSISPLTGALAFVSPVLEAIGLQWLAPVDVSIAPADTFRQPQKAPRPNHHLLGLY